MRRWNGWGDDTIDYALHPETEALIASRIGPGFPPRDARLTDLTARVPSSRLPPHPLISLDAADRVRHARGQSLPDLIALRTGQGLTFPDGVAYPLSEAEVRELLRYAQEAGIHLIPYGGGTSVAGHINVRRDSPPTLTVDLSRFSRLRYLDPVSHLATFEAGISGANLEAQLRARGYTLGHFPQSFDYSTLGGWIATRSKGQQSLHYGGIERLFAGGQLETPLGQMDLPPLVASAAGPDLREIVLGSEGRLGIITTATIRISPLPEYESFQAVFFPDFELGVAAAREMAQARLPLSMIRLSDPSETEVTLALAGHQKTIRALEWLLRQRGIGQAKCVLMLGVTGGATARATLRRVLELVRSYRGAHLAGAVIGNQWRRSRFRTPYLRNNLWEKGYAVDTVETATDWTHLLAAKEKIRSALNSGLQEGGERVLSFTHLSHVYPTGSSLYTTYVYRIATDPAETLRRWESLKAAASRAILEMNATITHQHGVGVDHMPYLAHEKGDLGIDAIRRLCAQFDPQGVMNPGKLVD
jgi:alkyldihydroxyacetonephosphate synthase